MKKKTIHFAHANGFPAQTYNKLFKPLRDDFEISYLDRLAHNPKYPAENNWQKLKEELREEIETRHSEPIIGMGHSFGGILHLMLAAEKPELYKSLVLLDSMIVSPFSSFIIKWFRNTKIFAKNSNAIATRFRRRKFESRDEAFLHYRKKSKFAEFDEDVLRDYVEHGLVETENGFELFIDPQVEAEIYLSIPDILPKLKGKIRIPTLYIGGFLSEEARLARINFMRNKFPFEFKFIEGTHLFPLEKPLETAETIKFFLRA